MPNRVLAAFAVLVAAAVVALAVGGCGDSDAPPTPLPAPRTTAAPTAAASCPPDNCPRNVVGSVAYLEDVALPPDAVLEVRIADVSIADAPSTTISERTIANPGQVPISFALGYDPRDIDERFDYSVQASITQGGRLLFVNDTVYSVLTRGYGERVDMVLVQVQRP